VKIKSGSLPAAAFGEKKILRISRQAGRLSCGFNFFGLLQLHDPDASSSQRFYRLEQW